MLGWILSPLGDGRDLYALRAQHLPQRRECLVGMPAMPSGLDLRHCLGLLHHLPSGLPSSNVRDLCWLVRPLRQEHIQQRAGF